MREEEEEGGELVVMGERKDKVEQSRNEGRKKWKVNFRR